MTPVLDKETTRKKLAEVECYALAVRDLLDTMHEDQFLWTKEGARKQYSEMCIEGEAACALAWMNEHYDSIEAAVRAAVQIAAVMCDAFEPLGTAIMKLTLEEEAFLAPAKDNSEMKGKKGASANDN